MEAGCRVSGDDTCPHIPRVERYAGVLWISGPIRSRESHSSTALCYATPEPGDPSGNRAYEWVEYCSSGPQLRPTISSLFDAIMRFNRNKESMGYCSMCWCPFEGSLADAWE